MPSTQNLTALTSSLAVRSSTLGSRRPFPTRFRSVGTSKAPPRPIQPRFESTAQDHIERYAHTFPPAIRGTKQPSLPSHPANTVDLQSRVTAWMDNTSKSIALPSAEAVTKSASLVHTSVTRSDSGSLRDAPSDTRSATPSKADFFGFDLQGLQEVLGHLAGAKTLAEDSRQPSPAVEPTRVLLDDTRSAAPSGGDLFGVNLQGLQQVLDVMARAKAGQPLAEEFRQPSSAAESTPTFSWDLTHSIHGYTGMSTAELDRQFFAKSALCQAAPGLTELNQRAAARHLPSQVKAALGRSEDSEISRVSTDALINRRRPTPNSQFPDDCTPSWIRDEIDERLAARQAAAEPPQDSSITTSATPSLNYPLVVLPAEEIPLHRPTPRPPPRIIRIPSNPSVKACRTLTLPSEPGFERPISPPRAPDTGRIWSWLRSFSHPEEERFARRMKAAQNTRSTFVGTLFNRFEQFASGACKNAYALYRNWRAKMSDSPPSGSTVTPSHSSEPVLRPIAFPKAAPRKISLFDSLKDSVLTWRPQQSEPRTRRSSRFYNPRFCPPHREFREI